MKNKISSLIGLLAGMLNGLLGSSGGMIIVPMLSRLGLEKDKAHATSVCIVLPLCIFSSCIYFFSGRISVMDVSPYLLWGLIGALIGSYLLTRIHPVFLKRVFGIVVLWGSYRMIFK